MNVCKAIMQLKFEAFLLWFNRTENVELYKQLMEAEEVTRINTNMNHETFQQVSWKFERIINLFDPFHKLTSNKEEYSMASFWNPYLEMVQTRCDFSKAIKIRDWDLHLHSSKKCLLGFMRTTISIMHIIFCIIGHPNKLYKIHIRRCMNTFKEAIFLFK